MNLYIPAKREIDKNFYYEFSLCEYDGIPIVFVATDDEGHLYICECTDMRFGEQNWTIADSTYNTISDLINQDITLYEALSRGKSITIVKCEISKKEFTHERKDFDQLTEEEKPEKDSYVWITNSRIKDEFIRFILSRSQTKNNIATDLNNDCGAFAETRVNESMDTKTNYQFISQPKTTTISFENSSTLFFENNVNDTSGAKAA